MILNDVNFKLISPFVLGLEKTMKDLCHLKANRLGLSNKIEDENFGDIGVALPVSGKLNGYICLHTTKEAALHFHSQIKGDDSALLDDALDDMADLLNQIVNIARSHYEYTDFSFNAGMPIVYLTPFECPDPYKSLKCISCRYDIAGFECEMDVRLTCELPVMFT